MASTSIVNFVLIPAQFLVVFFGLYNLTIWIISLFFKEKEYLEPLANLRHKFTFLICCHNEENVIADIIDSIRKIDYPEDLYEMYVICDNCTDESQNIVESMGVKTIVRRDLSKRGKGYGIEYALEYLFKKNEIEIGEGIIILDSDNLVDNKILYHINKRFNQGQNVVQVAVETKNVDDTWITKSDAIGFWSSGIFFQNAREKIGLSTQIMGTGYCVRVSTLKQYGFNCNSLCEDLEYSSVYPMKSGDIIHYCPESYVLDEKPLTLKASWNQRKRWMQGNWSVSLEYIPKLIKHLVSVKFDWKVLDNLIYLAQPMRAITASLLFIFGMISYLSPSLNIFPYTVWFILFSFFVFQNVYSLCVKGYSKFLYWLPGLYLFSLTSIPLTAISFFERKNRVWSSTVHGRNVASLIESQKENEIIAKEIKKMIYPEVYDEVKNREIG